MRYNTIVRIAILSTLLFILPCSSLYAGELNNHHVLVIYSSDSGEIDEHMRLLDLMIGHFTENIMFKSVTEVEKADLADKTHVFYYGQVHDKLPATIAPLITSFPGTVIALGLNSEQLGERYSFFTVKGNAEYNKIELTSNEEQSLSVYPRSVLVTSPKDDVEVLANVTNSPTESYPLFIKNQDNYYFASTALHDPLTIAFGDILHDVFQEEHEAVHPAYLRLEDVSPDSDPEQLMAIAKELKERDIPYMIALISVFTDPKNNKTYHLYDFPELVKVLQYMQANGASIVMHGYTHQFQKEAVSGEGFEFWDVDNDMPVYREPGEKMKEEKEFPSAEAHQAYLTNFEKNYIQNRINLGVQELANNGLYPLAFEAPHYTISQNGYRIVSEHFSHYAGQVQLSDKDWKIMSTSPYMSSPSFFHGMQLLTETLGYVIPNSANAIDNIMLEAEKQQMVRDGAITAFYHPFLGVEQLSVLLDELEKIPNLDWIDLKQSDAKVEANNVTITSENGVIQKEIDYVNMYREHPALLTAKLKNMVHASLWAFVSIGVGAILLFSFYIFKVVHRRNSRRGRRYLRRVA
ncbi:polysaccharide deacetylase family protein [Gracilibacillus salinarum]|uniref:Polysaccharide deacetylase family protein n=1 Tax=Gracilibacillus salinarum TaxID=2932255 RepID=A0ABY4GLM4_9BACI|nr:polysaccharide deacetylase family protein [Gracilibacillus salinarum]UOQ85182.1 polysaccharide deacetylase family protein [Gracilibacillus salinarum]